jgi:transcription termination factor Rho
VTDTQESVLDSAENSARAAAKRRSGSLSTMLLPDLQQLAGSLGITPGKLKKSELVTAIQGAQTGGSKAGASSSAAGSSDSAGNATANGTGGSARVRTRTPRTSDAGNSAGAGSAPPAGSAGDSGDSSSTTRDASTSANSQPDAQVGNDTGNSQQVNDRGSFEPAAAAGSNSGGNSGGNENSGRRERGQNPNRQDQRERQGGNRQSNSGGNSNNSSNNNSNGNGGNARNNNGNGGNAGNAGNSGNSGGGQSDDFDDDGPRRGRRYRDRRGRTRDGQRERVPGGSSSGNVDIEPTVSDDDILVPVAGILDAIEDKNTWFVRTSGYVSGPDDVYVANSYIRRFNLRRGDAVTGAIRQLRDGERREKYNPLVRLDTVNGLDPEQVKNRVEFTRLTPLYPQERLRLETEPHILTTRVIDLVMPIGKGQRALIVSPPKAGKTSVLQAIANAIATNNPECHLMVVLVDERPEEVTDMQRSVKGEVIASTFDRRPAEHTQIAELSIERAKRLVEMGHDVVVLLDSITRLGRAYNLAAPASGRILSGGVDSTALYPPKRFLGAARNIENGGSLTILCTALVETGSAGDTVIFEEFKGTGNAELKLDRKIADKRIFPAVDVDQSSTRKEELLLSPDELAVTVKLRRVLHSLDQEQAINLLMDRLRKTRTNLEFLMQIAKTTPGGE